MVAGRRGIPGSLLQFQTNKGRKRKERERRKKEEISKGEKSDGLDCILLPPLLVMYPHELGAYVSVGVPCCDNCGWADCCEGDGT